MKDDLLKLVELEKIDFKIYQLKRRKEEYPVLIEACQRDMNELEAHLNALKESSKQIELARKEKEIEIESNEEQMKKKDNQLTQIKKNDEYKAMLHQIEKFKKKNDLLEEEIIVKMDELDAVQVQIKDEDIRVKEGKEQVAAREKEIKVNLSRLEDDRKKLKNNSEQCLNGLSPKIKDIYLQVLNKRKDRALASIKEDTCGACHMVLLAEVIEQTRMGVDVIYCDTCSRILYHPDLLAKVSTSHLDDVL